MRNVNTVIAKLLIGKDARKQRQLDTLMLKKDGTENKTKLGANAILGVSLSCANAAANASKKPLYRYLRALSGIKHAKFTLPYPMINIENGGAHAGWILDFQECMIVPKQKKMIERVRCGSEIFHALGKILKKKGFSTLVGDEGGYAVPFKRNEDALKTIMQAIAKAGYAAGTDVMLAMDPATSEFYNADAKKYELKVDKKTYTNGQMIEMWKKLSLGYPIISIEDGLAEDDWEGWKQMTKMLGKRILLVGDDLFVTNIKRLKKGIDMGVANAILIKLNQIGSLTETLDCIALAKKHGYTVIVSHRSGETADTTIADLAVATQAEYIKTGSLSRSERVEKYNRLMEIEQELHLSR